MQPYEPKIVTFSCSFGWGYLVGREVLALRLKNWIPVICSGKVDTTHILKAFRQGADGVLILGCPDGHCHFQDGNYQTSKKVLLLQRVLAEFGLDPRRVRMEMAVDPEGRRIPQLIKELSDTVRALDPAAAGIPPAPSANAERSMAAGEGGV
jgi:F420-non-reducing hydrogenase iron-sulfur subunit